MATKNLKVLMSGDTKPYRAEIDKAAVATKVMKDDIGSHLNSIAGLFGTSTSTIGASAQKISTVFVGLTAAFSGAAAGGSAAAVANAALATSSTAVAGAEANLIVATAALAIAQGTAGISAEALTAAEFEVTTATAGLAIAQRGQALAQGAVTAATGFGTSAMKLFKLALASTGIGLLIVALGALVTYFTGTREGAFKIKLVLAEVGAVVTTLKDHFSSLGEVIYKFFTFDFAGSGKALKTVFSGLGSDLVDNASAAGELARQTKALNNEERENKVLQQQRMTRAAELRNDAKQKGVSAADKKKMLAETKQLIIEYYNEEKKIAVGRRDIAIEDSKHHKNTTDELNTLEDAKVKVLAVDEESAQAQKALSREIKGVNKEIAAQTTEIIKKAAEKRKADLEEDKKLGGVMKVRDKDMSFKTQQTIVREYKIADAESAKKDNDPATLFDKGIKKSQALSDARWRAEQKNISNTKTSYLDLSDSINSGIESMGSGMGEFFGSLLLGEGSVQSFGTMVAGVFADMAIQVGQLAIKTGLAALAIKIGLESMNPYIMIAAGIALVALGTAVKGSMSSIASGGGSGSMPSGNQNYNYDTRSNTSQASAQKVIVEVTGTLNASPKGLSTTLNKENTRVAIST